MISHLNPSPELRTFAEAEIAEGMADVLLDKTVELDAPDAVASCLISHNFGGKAVGLLMDRAIEIAKSRRMAA